MVRITASFLKSKYTGFGGVVGGIVVLLSYA